MGLSTIYVIVTVIAVTNAAPEWRVLGGEFKSYRQLGDQVVAEYERLHPDGTISRKEAVGDITKGLTYSSYQIDHDGVMHRLAPGGQTPSEQLGSSGDTPGDAVSRWKPDARSSKMAKNPLKNFFKDIFSW